MGKYSTLQPFSPDDLLARLVRDEGTDAERELSDELCKAMEAFRSSGPDALGEDYTDLLKAAGMFESEEEPAEEKRQKKRRKKTKREDEEDDDEGDDDEMEKALGGGTLIPAETPPTDALAKGVHTRLGRLEKAVAALSAELSGSRKENRKLLKAVGRWKPIVKAFASSQMGSSVPENSSLPNAQALAGELAQMRGVLDRTAYSPHPRNGTALVKAHSAGKITLTKAIEIAQSVAAVPDWQKATLLADIQTASSTGTPFEDVFDKWGLDPSK